MRPIDHKEKALSRNFRTLYFQKTHVLLPCAALLLATLAAFIGFQFGDGNSSHLEKKVTFANLDQTTSPRQTEGASSPDQMATSDAPQSNVNDPQVTELRQRQSQIEERMRQVRAKNRSDWDTALATNPNLLQMVDLYEQYQNAYLAEKDGPLDSQLVDWATGPPIEISDPIYAVRKAQVGDLRRALFIQEFSDLLNDADTAPLVRNWLNHRIQTMGHDPSSGHSLATPDNWRVVGDSLIPDETALSSIANSSNREALLDQYLAIQRLQNSTAPVPPHLVEHLRIRLRFGILNEAAYRNLRDKLPTHLIETIQASERLAKELRSINAQLKALQP